jgi:SNF2 family DNA or RNA helicase
MINKLNLSNVDLNITLDEILFSDVSEMQKFLDKYIDCISHQQLIHVKTKLKNLMQMCTMTLSRVKDNIKEKKCQCCHLPTTYDVGIYILISCCQIIVCEDCITRKNNHEICYINRCPNCLSDIHPKDNLIRIGFDIEILNNLSIVSIENCVDMCPNNKELYQHTDNKLRALTQILKGEDVECIENKIVEVNVDKLLQCHKNLPWPINMPKKYMIYTNLKESGKKIEAELDKQKIPYVVLRGSRTQRDDIIKTFQNDQINVLLASTPGNCSGIHLPYISHIIIYHKIVDKMVEAQVIARGQRCDRKYNLSVITLLNNDES